MSTAIAEPIDDVLVQDVQLEVDIFLVHVKKHRWGGEHILDAKAKAKVAIKGQEVENGYIKNSTVSLIPKSLQSVLTPGYAAVEEVFRRFTLNLSGARAVAAPSVDQFRAELKTARGALAGCVAEFKARYQDEVIDYNQARWGPVLGDDYQAVIGSLLPAVEALDRKFCYTLHEFKRLPAPSEDYKNYLAADEEMKEEIRQNKKKDYENDLDELASGPRKVLAEALDGLTRQLQEGKIIQRASFNAVLDAIALNRAFAGTIIDEKLLDTAQALEAAIDTAIADAEAQKTGSTSWSDLLSAHKGTLVAAMTPVAEAAKDSAVVEQVRRRLNARVRPVDVT